MKKIVLFILIFIHLLICAQITNETNTIGLLYTEPDKISEGYLLFAPFNSKEVYLIDNCGLVVQEWIFENPTLYSGCYLLEDGSVLKLNEAIDNYSNYNSKTCVERRNWENELLWQYCLPIAEGYFHSDIHILPNGNVLVLYLESFTITEAILNGVNPALINNVFELESVLELKLLGIDSAEIVWKWRLWDHLIQDYDESKNNYGNVADHPRKYNINLHDKHNHYNSIDYNETLDQIVLSSWNDHEIYIIDHSTTIEEAASSTGGNYGFGGDFLYRWGNPLNYGVEAEQKLLGQHNPRWIPIDNERFGGMISIFNNRHKELLSGNIELTPPILSSPFNKSTVVIINPNPEGDGIYDMDENQFLPLTYEYVLPSEGIKGDDFYSGYMSGAQVQGNGNIVTCEAIIGRFTEFDTDGNVVWQYKCPVENSETVPQGVESNGGSYKVEKYTTDYAGLAGRELCGAKTIENANELSEACKKYWLPKMSFLNNINGTTVSFTSISQNYNELMWDFGNENFSAEINPIHSYDVAGEFEVCLTGSNCYSTDTYCEKINIEITSINLFEKNGPVLVSNFVTDQLELINSKIEVVSIYNAAGNLESKFSTTAKLNINITNLSNGIYFLVYKYPGQNSNRKLKFYKIK